MAEVDYSLRRREARLRLLRLFNSGELVALVGSRRLVPGEPWFATDRELREYIAANWSRYEARIGKIAMDYITDATELS